MSGTSDSTRNDPEGNAAVDALRVLVVDGDLAARMRLWRIHSAAGHETVLASSKQDAVERLVDGGIDAVVCELRLSDAQGAEVLRAFTGHEPKPAIVAVTDVARLPDLADAIAEGAGGFMTKPFRAAELVSALHQAVRLRRDQATGAERAARLEQELRRRADLDALTQLFNRSRFVEELKRYLQDCAHPRDCGALLIVDLDRFRAINDTLGHPAGDRVLRQVGQVLKARVRRSDVVARLAADEFVVLLKATTAESAMQVAHDLRVGVGDLSGCPPVGASIGVVAFSGEERLDADDLMVAADEALDDAKNAGRNAVAQFGGEKSSSLGWIERIRTALATQGLIAYAQPIVDLGTGQIAGEELLVRMRGPDGAVIAPCEFLPAAERFGYIAEVDMWMLDQALDLAAAGRAVNVNVSARTLQDGCLPERIAARARTGIDPSLVTIEITETSAATNMERVAGLAHRLATLGCGLALDDFGTGFGTFTYLKHLPITSIKIDRDFVCNLASDRSDQRIVKAIVEIARAAGQTTVAEGVEDIAALDLLRRLGVDRAQGYYLGMPQAVDPQPVLATGAAALLGSPTPTAA